MNFLSAISKNGFFQLNQGEFGCLIPGSFNPLHNGHLAMARLAQNLIGTNVYFELSIMNVDKPTLNESDVRSRAEQNFCEFGLVLTSAPRFVEKARLFPGVTFGVGADTLIRIADIGYHSHSETEQIATFEELDRLECRFLVFPRKVGKNVYSQANLRLPEKLKHLCSFVPVEQFLWEISSTDLRSNQ